VNLPGEVPFWVQLLVSALLVLSGLLALTGAIGILRLKEFFQRMHPPALASTLGSWSACAACIAWFSALNAAPLLHTWVIPILLCISVPITTLMLSRAALLRLRDAGADVPAPLSGDARTRPSRTGQAPGQANSERGDRLPEQEV
jgi:multicomponent K+:H+ antiporter subunit G